MVLVLALALTLKPPYKHTDASPAQFNNEATVQTAQQEPAVTTVPVSQPEQPKPEPPKPQPTPVAKAVVASTYPKGCENYVALVQQYNWNHTVALQVMRAESGCNPYAVGDTRVIGGIYAPSCGLMQIRTLQGRPNCEQLKDPATNVAWAYKLYASSGWKPWSVCRTVVKCY